MTTDETESTEIHPNFWRQPLENQVAALAHMVYELRERIRQLEINKISVSNKEGR